MDGFIAEIYICAGPYLHHNEQISLASLHAEIWRPCRTSTAIYCLDGIRSDAASHHTDSIHVTSILPSYINKLISAIAIARGKRNTQIASSTQLERVELLASLGPELV